MVPFTPLAPPLKIPVAVSLAPKLISSVPTLISPEVGKAAELVKVIFVVLVFAMLAPKVFVTGPAAVPPYNAVPHPNPPSCCEGPTL